MAIRSVVNSRIFNLLLQKCARALFGLVFVDKVDDTLGIRKGTVVASANVATILFGLLRRNDRSQEEKKERFHHGVFGRS